MNTKDEFGHDPNIQRTRKYFARMEAMDLELIKGSGISFFDPKLRQARDMRLRLFGRACTGAARKGIFLDEETGIMLFNICQDTAFKKCGFKVSSLIQTNNPELLSLVKEAL
ncbi:MAG: hypothetical protein GXP56_17100 [Deltaproteobacteria bacterium]|nr:hypothetical protein [Deltaproteobacteria bacterium]